MKKILMSLIIISMLLTGCSSDNNIDSKQKVTIRIKCPPMTMAYDDKHPNAEIIDLFTEASEKFKEQYFDHDVEFEIEKYQYIDEKEKVVDKIGTDQAADILFGGSFNVPGYILKDQLVPLDDIIDKQLYQDIDEKIWQQVKSDGKTYLMPYYTLQNTLMVNADLMKKAGLQQYIPDSDKIAQWSTEDYNKIIYQLKTVMTGTNEYPMFMYCANNQGDMHIMTLLRAYGSSLYDENNNFNLNTPQGHQALQWLTKLNQDKIIPQGAENIEFISMIGLFYNNQIAICPGNLVNIRDAKNEYGRDIFLANSPSLDGNGYATTYLNGFILFDNGDELKQKVAKDFIRYIYTDQDLLKYALSGVPVNKSYLNAHKDQLDYQDIYQNNESNVVDNLNNRPNWQGVRDVFYQNIQTLLQGDKTVEEVAINIDKQCNAAIQEGLIEK